MEKNKRIQIAPSLLSANFANLTTEIEDVANGGADLLHIDIMDGHYVPNLTFGPPVIAALRNITNLPFDVHLMVTNPSQYIDAFAKLGASYITVHIETDPHIHRTLEYIKSLGVKAGITLNPGTSLSALEAIISYVDLVLIMSVNPGFGGQAFIPQSLARIQKVREMLDACGNTKALIEVDGGVNVKTAPQIIEAGADILVAGSAVFGHPSRKEMIQCLKGNQ